MALEAVVFPHDHDLFIQTDREANPTSNGTGGLQWCAHDQLDPAGLIFCKMGADQEMPAGEGGVAGIYPQEVASVLGSWADHPCASSLVDSFEQWDVNSSPEQANNVSCEQAVAEVNVGRRKRRRARPSKNKDEVENQRMTHIAVERNRRKQMNEYLAVLRSLMPPSYVQRGDQASIIGGAIDFVRELEQLRQSLEAQKKVKQLTEASAQGRGSGGGTSGGFSASPFAHVFTFPQYSTSSSSSSSVFSQGEGTSESRSAIADIEVTMVESHANLKVLSRRRPKQLLKIVVGLQILRLTTLHLNVTTIQQMVLYSFSLKVEDDCMLSSVDEIAAAVYRMLEDIQEAEL